MWNQLKSGQWREDGFKIIERKAFLAITENTLAERR